MIEKKIYWSKGATLVEILLTVSLITVFSAVAIVIYQTFWAKNDLDITTDKIVLSLRRAQVLAQGGFEDSSWGVHVEEGKVQIFQGPYASGILLDNGEMIFAENIELGGPSEIVFTKMTGEPSPAGTVTLTGSNNETREITINSIGVIDY
ncbi:hypothetical protein GF362_00275 [Candidatus Dojkabacteria bacterium]|nr:hypothetical protein [Candidatus Dojkabacteria bacterium]